MGSQMPMRAEKLATVKAIEAWQLSHLIMMLSTVNCETVALVVAAVKQPKSPTSLEWSQVR
jgi:hypothetical protein